MTATPPREAPAAAPVVPPYPLDRVSRKVPITGKAQCPPVALVRYQGDVVPFHTPLRINASFRDHVRDFERVVQEAATEVYGRPPTRIRHLGSYYCRRISTWPYLVSEHGLGNALDIGGFDFARVPAGKSPHLPRRFRKAFRVRVARHWNGRGRDAVHARFLRLLARRVIDREGLFRIILGPGHPNHQDHFHLDMARWRIVDVF